MRASVLAAILKKMQHATAGTLVFGPDSDDDVDQMRVAQDVLELRFFEHWPVADGKKMLLRLFFSEPRELEAGLLSLKWFWKYPRDEDALAEQSEAAKEASLLLAKSAVRNFE
jgi:hypothetical protein